jgi:hypothetical protein
MVKNSSSTKLARTLAPISTASVKTFLLELANLRNDVDAGKQFLLRFAGLWPPTGKYETRNIENDIDKGPGAKPELEQIIEMLVEHWLLPLREGVRAIWVAPDLRTRQWGVLRILDEMIFKEDISDAYAWPFLRYPDRIVNLPPPTAFEQVLRYLIQPNLRAYVCANGECPAPYFFGSRIGQKYCSEDCALPAQREFKRAWWAAHGNAWRRKKHIKKHARRKRK